MPGRTKRRYPGRAPVRVMAGQKAAICGLVLAGVRYTIACKIAGTNAEKMRDYVPRSWRRGKLPKPIRSLGPKGLSQYHKIAAVVGGDRAYAEVTRSLNGRSEHG